MADDWASATPVIAPNELVAVNRTLASSHNRPLAAPPPREF
jgi:hypothetical protein